MCSVAFLFQKDYSYDAFYIFVTNHHFFKEKEFLVNTTSTNHLDGSRFLISAKTTLDTELKGLQQLVQVIDKNFEQACQLIMKCTGRLVITGMGKSGLIGRKMAATFSSTGTPSFFMHPGEASHGDLGMLVTGDVMIAISNSGESEEIKTMMPIVRKMDIPVITISKNGNGFLPKNADVPLFLGESEEACPLGLAPTTSTTATLVLGDMLAVALLDAKGFTAEDFAFSHPAGALGKRLLLTVSDVMHKGNDIAWVEQSASLNEALFEMTNKRLGMTSVVDNNQLVGIFTDGDLRRTLSQYTDFPKLTMKQLMTADPYTINADNMAISALEFMKEKSINQLLVTNDTNELVGIVTLHDLIQSGLV